MKEWEKVRLGDCIQEINDRTIKNNQYEVLTSSKSGIYSQEEYFDKQVASKDNIGYKIIKRGQFTYRSMSDSGRFTINRLENKEIGIVSPAYPVFEAIKINPVYLKYYFESELFRKAIHNLSQGSTRTALKYKDLCEIEILLPRIDEQNKIVEILENVNKIIENLQKNIELIKKLKKNIFIEFYNNLNDRNSTIKELKELGSILKGNGLSKQDISCVGKECILYGELYTKYNEIVENIDSRTNAQLTKPIYSIKEDVLIPSSGETDIDISTATCVMKDNVILGGDLNVFRKRSNIIDGRYISYVINYVKKHEIARLAQGFSVVHLYGEHLKKIKIKVPSLNVQTQLIKLLEVMTKKEIKLKEKEKTFKNIKKGLIQRLLTGKVSVNA